MKFCECYRRLAEKQVRPGDFGLVALQEVFNHSYFESRSRRVLSAESYLFEVSDQQWKNTTGLSITTRDKLCFVLTRDKYPASIFLPEVGWAIFYCEGDIRDLLFARFKEFADSKTAEKEQRTAAKKLRVEAFRTKYKPVKR